MGFLSSLFGKKSEPETPPEPVEAPPDEETREGVPVEELIAGMEAREGGVRVDAVRALLERWRRGDGQAAEAMAPHVHELLADSEPLVRAAALQAVRLFRKPENLERCASGVLAALADAAPQVRTAAVWSALRLPGDGARQQVRAVLESTEEPMRFAAACALSEVHDAAALPELLKALHEGHRRQEAISALMTLGDNSCVGELGKLFDAEEESALEEFDKTLVAAALARFGDPRGPAHLVERISTPADDRPIAAEWAGRLHVEEAIPALSELVEEEGDPARGAALRALGRLRAPGAEERLLAFARDVEGAEDLRMDAAEGLAELGSPAALEQLRAMAGEGGELGPLCQELLVEVAANEAASAGLAQAAMAAAAPVQAGDATADSATSEKA